MRARLPLLPAVFVVIGLAGIAALLVFHSALAGVCLLVLAAAGSLLVTMRTARGIRRLEAYTEQLHPGARVPLPGVSAELDGLATAIDEMRERLEDRERVEHSVRTLAHEMKAPLAEIEAAAALLGDDSSASDRERLARQIRTQSRRLLDLGDRLGALSHLEGQRAIAHPRAIDLLALIDEVATSQVPLAIQHGIGLVWEARADVELRGDPESLALLFANLWSNALHFAPEGTSIAVSLRRAGSQALFSMRDEGPGVSEFELAQLGERFFSLPRPRDGLRGSGLGLAIVRQAAALHGGAVAFERAAPGLRVTLRLPL